MNAQSIMIFPSTFEQKIGFPHIKTKIIDRCHSNMAKERVENITFSSDFDTVKFTTENTSKNNMYYFPKIIHVFNAAPD